MRFRPDVLRFNGMRAPSTDFEAVRDDLQIPYLWYELDLSTARSIAAGTQITLPLKGNSFYIDQNTDVGNATVIFHDPAVLSAKPGRMYAQPGFNAFVPFDTLTFENVAQAGKVLRIFYGVDIDFKPGNTNAVTINGTISVAEQGSNYGVSFQSNALQVANTALQVFAAVSNPNGAILWNACINANNNAGGSGIRTLLAKATAPANNVDGDVYLAHKSIGSGVDTPATMLPRPIRIPAGKGLYFFNDIAEATCVGVKSCQYTLL